MTNEEARQVYEEAVRHYDAKEFAEALELLDSLEVERPDSRRIIYYRALCLIELGRVKEANVCRQKLVGRIEQESLQRLSNALVNAKPTSQSAVDVVPEVEVSAVGQVLADSDNIFLVQTVYPVSAEECSVIGNVKQGIFHAGDVANVVNDDGSLLPAPITRIGSADTPLLLAREGQRTILALHVEPGAISPGVAIICETRPVAHAVTVMSSDSSEKTPFLERAAELTPIEKLLKQGDHQEAEHLLNAYIAQHPDSIVAKRMLAQVYLEAEVPLRDPAKALYLIRVVYQAGGNDDPAVTNLLARAQAENGDPEMGLRFLERLYASTLDVAAKQALAQRIHDFRSKYKLGDVWEFSDNYHDAIFESSNVEEAIRAVVKGAVPLDAGCRRNRVGHFEPIETTLAPVSSEVAALFKPKAKQQWDPLFIIIMIFLLIGILLALFLPSILRVAP